MPLSGMQQLNQLIDELEIVISNTKSSSSISRPEAIISSTEATSECKQKGADKHQTLGVAAKKEKNVAEPRVKEATPSDEININSLDLRVGIIRSVVRHEGSEKLYCEDIDVGEDELRPIASGLVPFYSLEEMQGRRVVVVANLLPRKLVGFKSNGMVLCASKVDSDGKEVVEFVDPPASAVPGERIIGSGLSSLPLSAKQCDKRKAFETLASNLIVDSNGFAMWNGLPLVTQSTGEQCSVPKLRDCFIH
jgi:methionine--tRNA ligase beta chain